MYPTTIAPLVLNERLPDPAVKILDKSFEKYRVLLGSVERISQGYSWAEGAVYFGDARCLLWSDIPNSRIMRWDEATGATSVYRQPSNYANGNTRDRQGRLVTAEHGRRVTRTEYDGRVTVLMDRYEGKRLSSPNDVVVKSDDSIWFTDMTAGIDGNWNGETGEQELPQRVYRIDGSLVGSRSVPQLTSGAHAWDWDGTLDGITALPDGRYVLQLVGAAAIREVAVRVAAHEIARHIPLAAERRLGLVHLLPVSDRPRVAPHPAHADFAVRQIVAQVVTDADIESRHHRAKGAGLHRARLVGDEDVPHLGRAETVEQLDTECFSPALVELDGQCLSGRCGEPQG